MLSVQRIIKYASVNAILLPFNLGVAWFLTELGVHYLTATIAGFALQITIAFFINRHWTFMRPEVRAFGGIFRASIVEASAFIVVLITAASAVEILHLDFVWARLIAVATSGIWCYVMDTHFTFRIRRS